MQITFYILCLVTAYVSIKAAKQEQPIIAVISLLSFIFILLLNS